MAEMVKNVEKRTHGKVLVLDDKYSAIGKGREFDRQQFEKRVADGLPFHFVYSDAWDKAEERYTVAEALRSVQLHKPDAVLLDIMFGDDSLGLDILKKLTVHFPALPVVTMTTLGRDDIWIKCARLGAVDYLHKPLNARSLWQTLDRYVGVPPELWLVGQSSVFLEAVNLAALASEGGRTPVMITGETGTGKELLARYIHRHGCRSDKPYEVIFLPGIPADLQASSLFGHSKGAFTGADRNQPGRFNSAHEGIAFLDEIGDIPTDAQIRLLRVADRGEIMRVGDGAITHADVQIVSATNADLARKIKNEEFRFDLWARLNGMPVVLPPLTQRYDDIPLLVHHLLRVEAIKRKRPIPALSKELEEKLLNTSWDRTNVRALLTFAQRVFDLAGKDSDPNEENFLRALPPVETRPQGTGSSHSSRSYPREAEHEASAVIQDGSFASVHGGSSDLVRDIEELRLRELAILYKALQKTLDPITGKPSRAKAAALLLHKSKCSTNEFDRWVKALWDGLSPANRKAMEQRFPELAEIADA